LDGRKLGRRTTQNNAPLRRKKKLSKLPGILAILARSKETAGSLKTRNLWAIDPIGAKHKRKEKGGCKIKKKKVNSGKNSRIDL